MQHKEVGLGDYIIKFKGFIASRSMITYLVVELIDLEDSNDRMG